MKILSAKQMHQLDNAIIDREGITSYKLMERAAQNLSERIMQKFPDTSRRFVIFCGSGNNGGDGLAIGRMLYSHGYFVECFLMDSNRYSDDCNANYNAAKSRGIVSVIGSNGNIPQLSDSDIVIDALFGSGLNRKIEGLAADVVNAINDSNCFVIAIDIPSGLADNAIAAYSGGAVVRADLTLTIESPFLSLLIPENYDYVGEFEIVPLVNDKSEFAYFDTDYYYTTLQAAKKMHRPRGKFSHKGTFGHTLLMTGALGKAGAAVLCSKACHRAGTGLLTVAAPSGLLDILQISTPETMVLTDVDSEIITDIPALDRYSAVGIGPGIGTDNKTAAAVKKLLQTATKPLVIDADALNIIAANPDWMSLLPKDTILTPHPKEFERLFGKTNDSIECLELLSRKAFEHNIIIVLKGAHTAIADSDGSIYFNSTGNPGMATAGSGDVLAGVIAALLSQKYPPLDAARLGVYIHGLAGDIVAERVGIQGIVASDIVGALPIAIKNIADS